MYFSLRRFLRLTLSAAVAAPILFASPSLGAADAPAAQSGQPPANAHAAPPEVKRSELAHKVLADGLRLNALAGPGLEPWHIKIEYQMLDSSTGKPDSGTVEQWTSRPLRWKRTYVSAEPAFNGSQWNVSRITRFQSKSRDNGFRHHLLTLRITRPVIDPLYQAANIKPDYQMQIQMVTTGGLKLVCVSVVHPERYAPKTDPNFLFPTYCFDTGLHLHLVVAGSTTVQFEDLQPFQNRTVAHKVTVIERGRLISQMTITTLETWSPPDNGFLSPPSNAILQPYTIEPGQPQPVPVYQVAASIPILDGGRVFRGAVSVPVIIRKDGSVKIAEGAPFSQYQALEDAMSNAISRWKYQPYTVDGTPVDVSYQIPYVVDGKPFVPVYDLPKPQPGDFSTAYDFRRDPAQDLATAETEAQQQHKRILLEVGGDWCYWCHQLDDFFKSNPDVTKLRADNFIFVKVNMGPTNTNATFLSQFPQIPGYPWIFVLDANGKLLKSQDTDHLNNGRAYQTKPITEFLTAWKPGGPGEQAAK
ncbi:MAG TPA: thioredoxin family protein [Terracidiphilus sp.]|nr:thioredoxin family protein [Terracidiphilus sp.]